MKITPKETTKLLNIFNDIYEELYEKGKYDNSYALEFDKKLQDESFKKEILFPFNTKRKDIISSDREAVAFMMACEKMGLLLPEAFRNLKVDEKEIKKLIKNISLKGYKTKKENDKSIKVDVRKMF